MAILCWQFEKLQLFNSIEERFKSSKTVTLSIATKKITWVKQNRELLFNGRMFDVSSIKFHNQHAIITGHFDSEEDEINKKIRKSTGDNENTGGTFLSYYLKIFNAVSNQTHYSYLSFKVEPPVWNRKCFSKVLSPSLNVATPPPDGEFLN